MDHEPDPLGSGYLRGNVFDMLEREEKLLAAWFRIATPAEEGRVRRLVPAEEAGPVSYWVSQAVNLQRRERRKAITAGVTHSEAPSVGSVDPNPVASEEEDD